jgi:hypothetical protein
MDGCLGALENKVTLLMNQKLLVEFIVEEISEALQQMAPLKEPCSDGFQRVFTSKIGLLSTRRYVQQFYIFLILE